MKKSKLLRKEIEKQISLKSKLQGVIEGDYKKEDIYESWALFSDSVRRQIFYVTDSKVITQINLINTKLLCDGILQKKTSEVKNESVLNVFEILWNLSNAINYEEKINDLDKELIEFARKLEPGTNLLRIKSEFVPNILKIIEESLENSNCWEGHKIILPHNLFCTFFPERHIKSWEDLEISLAFMLENLILRAHLERMTNLYKEKAEQAFKEFEGIIEIKEKSKPKKHKKRKPKSKQNEPKILSQNMGNSEKMKSVYFCY